MAKKINYKKQNKLINITNDQNKEINNLSLIINRIIRNAKRKNKKGDFNSIYVSDIINLIKGEITKVKDINILKTTFFASMNVNNNGEPLSEIELNANINKAKAIIDKFKAELDYKHNAWWLVSQFNEVFYQE